MKFVQLENTFDVGESIISPFPALCYNKLLPFTTLVFPFHRRPETVTVDKSPNEDNREVLYTNGTHRADKVTFSVDTTQDQEHQYANNAASQRNGSADQHSLPPIGGARENWSRQTGQQLVVSL